MRDPLVSTDRTLSGATCGSQQLPRGESRAKAKPHTPCALPWSRSLTSAYNAKKK